MSRHYRSSKDRRANYQPPAGQSKQRRYQERTALEGAVRRVRTFHQLMGQTVGDPQKIAITNIPLRVRLIAEEFFELLEAIVPNSVGNDLKDGIEDWCKKFENGYFDWKDPTGACRAPEDRADIEDVADSLADITYVVLGAAVTWGIPLGPVFEEVCRANDDKVGGPVREDGKRLKPPGWKGPDIAGVLKAEAEKGCRHYLRAPWDCGCGVWSSCQSCEVKSKCRTCGALCTSIPTTGVEDPR